MNWISISELNGDLKSFKGESLIFHCEVVQFSQRSSKKGNRFGILEVKSDHDQNKFFLFGEYFMKFRGYGVKGRQLLIKGSARKQRFSDNYEFIIEQIKDVF